ncbi:MAG TPA: hypothetical protein VEY09_15865 [Pyrinomonadaceae bacterium]|nr:hypothetical protein [Pyrinomonadaceae bacterium]
MEFYLALIIALGMTAVAGVLYYYTLFLEARARQMRRRIAEVERANAGLLAELGRARELLARATAEGDGEFWPETLGEHDASPN